MTDAYSSDFYKDFQHGSRISAEVILPPIFQAIKPQSMIDVGCGVGTWMTVAQRLGARCVGLEGDWIQNVSLPALDIRVVDLEQPISLDKKFDLALCMEVGEHLSQPRSKTFVHDLCGLSDCVLFSAAIPGQRGTSHINLQWQSWWAASFAHNGFVLFDCIRPRVWNNRAVERWYRQNAFLYVEKSKSDRILLQRHSDIPIDIVHHEASAADSFSLRRLAGSLMPRSIKRTLKAAEREIHLRLNR